MKGWLNASLKSAETRDELSTTAIRKLCHDACQYLMLHPTSLPQEQAAKSNITSMVRIQVLKSFRVHFAPGSNGRSFPLEYS